MADLVEDLCGIFGQSSQEAKARTIFGPKNGMSLLVPATVDVIFVDVTSWLVNDVPVLLNTTRIKRHISRAELFLKFVDYIANLWKTRPRSKIIVLLAEKPNLIPSWIHRNGQEFIQKDCSDIPDFPLPYLWNDDDLGGPQGFESWICTPQGRLECTRTLLKDLISTGDVNINNRLVPSTGKTIILECDIPGQTWKMARPPNADANGFDGWFDKTAPGCTGDTFITLKNYVETIQASGGTNKNVYGTRTYELISASPDWCIMSIHLSFLSESDKFVGPSLLVDQGVRDFKLKPRFFWNPEPGFWFGGDIYYSMLRTIKQEMYEPWTHVLAIYLLNGNPLLNGTNIGSKSLIELWELFEQWRSDRTTILKNDAQDFYRGMFAFINPATHVVVTNTGALASFLWYVQYLGQMDAEEDFPFDNPGHDWKATQQLKMMALANDVYDDVSANCWKIVLLEHANQQLPFPLAKDLDIKQRQTISRLLLGLYNKNRYAWDQSNDLTGLLKMLGYDPTTNATLYAQMDVYFTNVKNSYQAEEAKFKTLLQAPTRDFAKKLGEIFKADNPSLYILRSYILKEYASAFSFTINQTEARISNAWRNTVWHMIYRTVGNDPIFVEKEWYFSVEIWGWNRNGKPLTSMVKKDFVSEYSKLDETRSSNPTLAAKFYLWDDLFKPNSLPTIDFSSGTPTQKNLKNPFLKSFDPKKVPLVSNIDIDESKSLLQFSIEDQAIGDPYKIMDLMTLHSAYSIPDLIWNAYLFKLTPGIVRNPAQPIDMPVIKLFPPILQSYVTPKVAELDDMLVIGETLACVEAFINEAEKHQNLPFPVYAETLIREMTNRFWPYALHYTKLKGPRPVDLVSAIATTDTFKGLSFPGTYGLLLDYVTQEMSYEIRKTSAEFVCGTFVFYPYSVTTITNNVTNTVKSWRLVLQKNPFGSTPTAATTPWTPLTKPGGATKTDPKRLTDSELNGAKLYSVSLSLDDRIYDVLEITPTTAGNIDPLTNSDVLEKVILCFKEVLAKPKPNNLKPFNSVQNEIEWTLFQTTSKGEISWRTQPFFFAKVKGSALLDPFRLLYIGTLRNENTKLSLTIATESAITDVKNPDRLLLKEQTEILASAHKLSLGLKRGETHYMVFTLDPKFKIEPTKPLKFLVNAPGVISLPGAVFITRTGTPSFWGVAFHSIIWSEPSAFKALEELEKNGIIPVNTLANRQTAKIYRVPKLSEML